MNRSRPRILIVEDDKPTAVKFLMALEEIGDSRIAKSAVEVYKEMIDFDPELILLDIKLEGEKEYRPEEAGIRILEQIKAFRPPFSEIPVVIITGFDEAKIESRCRELGAVDFYKKPVPLQTLRLAVQKAYQEQLSRRQQQISVFISSPMKELRVERQIVKQAILDLRAPFKPELAEDWTARPEPPIEIWQRAAKECDIFVLLLGKKFGTPSPGTGISPTEDEYNQARSAGKPILVFLKEVPEKQRDPLLTAFLARLYDPDSGHLVRTFTTHGQLRAEIQRAIRAIDLLKRPADSLILPTDGKFRPARNDRDAIMSLKILFLAADPTDASRLRLGEELREIQEKLQLAKLRDRFELHQRMSVRPADISQAMLDVEPQIVHFSGHGTMSGALCLENMLGEIHPIRPDSLAALFEQFAGQVNCVVLNACYSEAQANAIIEHIDYVVGMNQAIGDRAAIAFAVGFYQALGAGRTIEEAYKLGCVQIRLQNIPEHLTPALKLKSKLSQIFNESDIKKTT